MKFTKGYTWRKRQPYWDKAWLEYQYGFMSKSAKQIADQQGCKENNILYFLKKLGINRRTMGEIRAMKYWGSSGDTNGMFGKIGDLNPNWRGGITPERQAHYSSMEWASAVREVWIRDRATCQRCEHKKIQGDIFHIHHIVPFEIEDMRSEIGNLLLVCKKCHDWIHSKENTNKDFIDETLLEQ